MHIKHKKDLRLYQNGKKGIWSVRFRVPVEGAKAREVFKSTGKSEEKLAREVAWQIYQQEQGDADVVVAPQRNTFAKLEKLRGVYLAGIVQQSCGNTSLASAKGNVQALWRVVGLALGTDDVESVRANQLTSALVDDWRRARYAALGLQYGRDVNLRVNYSLNSEWTAARAVFSRPAKRLYRKQGLKLPQLDDFLEVSRLKEEKPGFAEIQAEVMKRMDADAAALYDTNPRVAVVYELARYVGLRSDEILGCRVHWLERAGNDWELVIKYRDPLRGEPEEWKPKAKARRVPVADERVQRWLNALEHKAGSKEYLVQGATKTERKDVVERLACAWVAQYIPERTKRLHELRKQCATEVSLKMGSPIAGALFIGDSLKVALDHYVATGGFKLEAM